MGFGSYGYFGEELSREPEYDRVNRAKFLREMSCKVCSLNRPDKLQSPYMVPTGSTTPDVYIIAEAPGAEEDRRGIQLIGPSGQVLRSRVPDEWHDRIRWSNIVRCRPTDGKGENREPTWEEITCCQGLNEADIEATRPRAIFGFGNVPLSWATGLTTGITLWAGRRLPLQVGSHACWYFPMIHPAHVLHSQREDAGGNSRYGTDIELTFEHHLREAFEAVDTLPGPVVHTGQDARAGVAVVTGSGGPQDVDRIRRHLERVAAMPICGLDIETHRSRPYVADARILTVAVADEQGTLAFPIDHPGTAFTAREKRQVNDLLRHFLLNATCHKAIHNAAFEMEWLGTFYGRELIRAGTWGDSMVQSYTLDERPATHSLEFVGIERFGLNLKALSILDRARLIEAPLPEVLAYNGIDAKYHLLAYQSQYRDLKARRLLGVYRHLMRRVPTFVLTQMQGVPVDQGEVAAFRDQYSEEIAQVTADIAALSAVRKFEESFGKAFRPSSTQDVAKLVRKVLGHQVESTDEEALAPLGGETIELILRYRKATKSLSTYVVPLVEGSEESQVFPDGLLHPTLSTRTRTGRTSCAEPNMQNHHKRSDQKILRRQVRKAGCKVVAFDYSGIQARNVAMESRDPTLTRAFWDRYDIHKDWMERLARLYPAWVAEGVRKLATDKQLAKAYRHKAKNEFVFPSFFGARGETVAHYLGVPEHVGVRLSELFWSEFPAIKGWHEKVNGDYRQHGYVTGLTGFRRRAPISANQRINSPIQADEALLVCEAMCRLSELDPDRFQAALMIHDDLTFLWEPAEVEQRAEVVVTEMLRIEHDWINVPLAVEMSVGDNWAPWDPDTNPDGLKEVATYSSDEWFKNA